MTKRIRKIKRGKNGYAMATGVCIRSVDLAELSGDGPKVSMWEASANLRLQTGMAEEGNGILNRFSLFE
jgi:hypothetical protein